MTEKMKLSNEEIQNEQMLAFNNDPASILVDSPPTLLDPEVHQLSMEQSKKRRD